MKSKIAGLFQLALLSLWVLSLSCGNSGAGVDSGTLRDANDAGVRGLTTSRSELGWLVIELQSSGSQLIDLVVTGVDIHHPDWGWVILNRQTRGIRLGAGLPKAQLAVHTVPTRTYDAVRIRLGDRHLLENAAGTVPVALSEPRSGSLETNVGITILRLGRTTLTVELNAGVQDNQLSARLLRSRLEVASNGPASRNTPIAVGVVGVEGGQIPLGASRLNISRGAFADLPALVVLEEENPVGELASPLLSIQPHGVQFGSDVEVSLPYDPRRLSGLGIREIDQLVTVDGEPVPTSIDVVHTMVRGRIRHFSAISTLADGTTCYDVPGVRLCRHNHQTRFSVDLSAGITPRILHGPVTENGIDFLTIDQFAALPNPPGTSGLPILVMSTVESSNNCSSLLDGLLTEPDNLSDPSMAILAPPPLDVHCYGLPVRTLIAGSERWVGGSGLGCMGQVFLALNSQASEARIAPFRAESGSPYSDALVVSNCMTAACRNRLGTSAEMCAQQNYPILPAGFDIVLGSASTVLWNSTFTSPCLSCAGASYPATTPGWLDCLPGLNNGNLSCQAPRVGVGVSSDGHRLYGFASDVNSEGGATDSEVSAALQALGATRGILLDGGHAGSVWFDGNVITQYDTIHRLHYGAHPRIVAGLAFYRAPISPTCTLGSRWTCSADGTSIAHCVGTTQESRLCPNGCAPSTQSGQDDSCIVPCPSGLTATWSCDNMGNRVRCIGGVINRDPCPIGCPNAGPVQGTQCLPATCPSGTWPIWTCNQARTARSRCVNGIVTTDPCADGCSPMASGMNDICCNPSCANRCGGQSDGCRGTCNAPCPSLSSVHVESPNGGEHLTVGVPTRIRWSTQGAPIAVVRIDLYEGSRLLLPLAANQANNLGSQSIEFRPLPEFAGRDFRIGISVVGETGIFDFSDGSFHVDAPSVALDAGGPSSDAASDTGIPSLDAGLDAQARDSSSPDVLCGDNNQPCCGSACPASSSLVCLAGTCRHCGLGGEPCCASGTMCASGSQCASLSQTCQPCSPTTLWSMDFEGVTFSRAIGPRRLLGPPEAELLDSGNLLATQVVAGSGNPGQSLVWWGGGGYQPYISAAIAPAVAIDVSRSVALTFDAYLDSAVPGDIRLHVLRGACGGDRGVLLRRGIGWQTYSLDLPACSPGTGILLYVGEVYESPTTLQALRLDNIRLSYSDSSPACMASCSPGLTPCSGGCVDTAMDNGNCGVCGRSCPAGMSCRLSSCTSLCAAPTILCGASCVNTQTDSTNCNRCGNACPVGTACQNGLCGCPTGQSMCGASCVNLQTDLMNCGRCGSACASGQVCNAGTCQITCASPNTRCISGAMMSCTNLQTDSQNCGACGRVCALGNAIAACASASCAIASCNQGWGDCNTSASDGCEASLSTAMACGSCSTQCSGGTPMCAPSGSSYACVSGCSGTNPTRCGSMCTNTTSDPLNCGACGNACPVPANGRATCSTTGCGLACNSGFHVCGGACVSNTAIASCGPTSCAACTTPANTTATCDGIACGFTCNSGFANCDMMAGNGCESNLSAPATCGSCTNSCSAGTPVCSPVGGSFGCTSGCSPPASTRCGMSCTNTLTDTANCGSCGSACPTVANATATCSAGACGVACSAGFVLSGGVCLPPVPRQIAPMSTANVTSRRPILEWRLAAGTDGARADLCRNRAMTVACISVDVAGSSGTPSTDLAAGVWFWRLHGRVGTTTSTATGPVWQLHVGTRTAPVNTSWGSVLDGNGDGNADILIGTNYGNGAHYYPGTASGPAASGLALTPGSAGNNYFGNAAGSAGDVNGDGYGDAIVGDYGLGKAHIYFGGPSGFATSPNLTLSVSGSSFFGHSVASAGDVNRDGYGDLVIGADNSGSAYVFHGGPSGPAASPIASLAAPSGARGFGISVANAGDVNGDGYQDVVVGAAANYSIGTVFTYHGSNLGIGTVPTLRINGVGESHFGQSVDGVGDVNGDGYTDIIIGDYDAFSYMMASGASIYLGSASGIVGGPSPRLTGPYPFGSAVSAAGDVNADGYSDVIVGAYDWTAGGSVFVFLGGTGGVGTTASTTLTNPTGRFGYVVGGAGDVDRDGYYDVIIGSPAETGWNGAARVFPGGSAGTRSMQWPTILPPVGITNFGYAVSRSP